MFGGAFVVDHFALVLDGVFVVAGYVVVLLSTNYIAEGDYWEGEYYILLLSSVLGMMVMASARDLITIFVALELLSIPAYMLAAFRKRDLRSNEAGLKYYLMGVFASAHHALRHVADLRLHRHHRCSPRSATRSTAWRSSKPIVSLAIVFMIIGFAFKVSAVPFHTWAPDTYEGAPTPVTAFLATASKAAGFVALMELVFVGLPRPPRRLRADDVGAVRGVDDGRQPHRPAPDQHRAHARLLRHRPGRLHHGAAGGGRHEPGRRARTRCRPWSPTSSSTSS